MLLAKSTVLLFLLISIVSSSWASTTTQVKIAINEAPPYRIIENNQITGFYVEIVEAIGKELNWQISYEIVPFRRALKMLEDGTADLMLGPVRKPERELYIDYSIPAFPPERRLFLYKIEKHIIHKYEDLRDKKIGVLRGAAYFEPFDSDLDLLKETGTKYENLLRMLDKGYLDNVIMPELLSVELREKLGLKIKTSPFFVPGETSYIGISKKSKLVEQIFDIKITLEEFKLTEEYENILLKYLEQKP